MASATIYTLLLLVILACNRERVAQAIRAPLLFTRSSLDRDRRHRLDELARRVRTEHEDQRRARPRRGGTGGDVGAPGFTPDGTRLVFDADSDGSSAPLALNASGCDVLDFAISPDGAWVSFLSRECGNNLTPDQLYARPIDGSSSLILVNGPLPPSRDVLGFGVAGDSSYAVYRADEDVNGIVELYSTPLPVLP